MILALYIENFNLFSMDEVVEALYDTRIRAILEKAIAVETKEEAKRENYLGWEWYEVEGAPQTLNYMVRLGLLKINFKSNKSTYYMVKDRDRVIELLSQHKEQQEQQEQDEIPDDLFDVIVMHDDKKELLMKALHAEKPVHVLLIGDIASGKTVFLQELARLPGAEYALGSRLSAAGIYDLMFAKRPRYLILDELDKVDSQDNISALLSLMETGILSEMKYKRRRQDSFKVWVFAGANWENKIPPEILSRFGAYRLRFRQYTPDEYIQVATNVLIKREGVEPGLARYIAEQTLNRLGSRDVREARSVARTARSKEDVDSVISLLEKQRRVGY
jgi:Holliday junction DNA helicase RuvB